MSKHNSHNQDNHQDPDKQNDNKSPQSMSGFNGKYEFTIADIFKRAYQLSKTNNWTIVQALVCIIGISFSVYLVYLNMFDIDKSALLDPENSPLSSFQQVTIEMTLTILLAPLWTGAAMIAVFTARKKTVNTMRIFGYYKMLPMLAMASIIISIFFTFGIMLLFLPGVYIFIATTFTLPLIADKNLSPLQAIFTSIKMANIYLTKMVLVYLLFFVMLFVVIISFGIAYLWVGPLYFNVKAILYQDLFCTDQQVEYTEISGKNDGVFDA